ncbi:MAG: flavin reductase [Clostridia bacterium]|nr:flavin reductase [Clostridia bacterium]
MASAYHSITYGLFLLAASAGGRHNACIINTAQQVSSSPATVSITVSKQNLTHDFILASGRFSLSVLTEDAPFALFQHFGMQSGRDGDKFSGFPDAVGTGDGLLRLTKYANAYFTCTVTGSYDAGTHTVFFAAVDEAVCLAPGRSVSYGYYQKHIKAAQPPATSGWRCTVCGHLYPEDSLPADYICPICKHGATDFVRVKSSNS